MLCSAGITLISFLFLVLGDKINVMSKYVDIIGELTAIKNESAVLEVDYNQRVKSLEQKGALVTYEELESFTKCSGDVSVKEVSILTYVNDDVELVAVVPDLYNAFSVKSGDLLCVTYTINADIEGVLGNIMTQKIVYRELKVLPLSNEIQITFLY